MLLLLFLIVAYLFGSLSTAIIACKAMGLPDPRTQGSGNPGATNVMRLAGKKLAVVVLIGDVLKGLLVVLAAKSIGLSTFGISYVALAVFLGHLYPIFFKFRGGKGVATALGALLAISWPLAVALIVTWLVVMLISRYVSLASITAAASAMVYARWLAPTDAYLAIVLMGALLIWRHRENIQRLMVGQENKFGKSAVN